MVDKIRVALVGQGIGASLSPAMHEGEGRAQGLDLAYGLIETGLEERPLGEILARARDDGLTGLNITHPHKIEVLAHLDDLSETAERLGAVNTVVFRDGRALGHNTDVTGFAAGFAQEMAGVAMARVLLLGAGGAGAAVAFALMARGVGHLVVRDPDGVRARALVAKLRQYWPGAGVSLLDRLTRAGTDGLNGVVNATPMGMANFPGAAFPAALLHGQLWVGDIVYFPLETALLANARALGCRVMPGSAMAIWQAVHAFELFTGRRADPARMRAIFFALTHAP